MNESEIERHLRQGIREATPDLLESLVDELGLDAAGENGASEQGNEPVQSRGSGDSSPETRLSGGPSAGEGRTGDGLASSARKSRRARRWLQAGLSAAAVLLIAIGVFSLMGQDKEAFAIVGLDVNPSIEISVDDNERVFHVDALNEEAEVVLSDLELTGTDLNTACHAVVGSMLVKGYLSSDTNSILVSVRSLDAKRGKEIEQRLSEGLNSFMEDSKIAVAILGQYVESSEGLERFAEDQAISLGKAELIKKLLAVEGTKSDEQSLLKLSTQELILLAQQRGVDCETSIGASDTSEFISKERAVDAALRDAGSQKSDATSIEVEFDCEDGVLVYEVDFLTSEAKYEYAINARTGKVLSSEVEAVSSPKSQQAAQDQDRVADDQLDDDDSDDYADDDFDESDKHDDDSAYDDYDDYDDGPDDDSDDDVADEDDGDDDGDDSDDDDDDDDDD